MKRNLTWRAALLVALCAFAVTLAATRMRARSISDAGAHETNEPQDLVSLDQLGSIKTYEPDGSYRQDSKPFAEIIKYQQLWLRVVYEIFPINVEPKVDGKYRFGKKLRNRWRQFGDLWLDNVPSEPIPINLHAAEKD